MGLLGDADSQANFALAAGLLGGGNFGQAFGRGLAGYQATLNQDADRKMQEAYRRAQMLQIEQAMQQRQAGTAAAQMQADLKIRLANDPAPDFRKYLAAGLDPKWLADYAGANNLGKPKVARTLKGIGPDGREYEYQVDEQGNRIGEGLPQFRAPLSVNQGNQTTFADPYTLKPVGSFQINQSPDSLASDRNAAAGRSVQLTIAGMNDARQREMADIARETKNAQKEAQAMGGKSAVDGVVASLRDQYRQLDEAGAITNPENGAMSNLSAGISSSAVGQATGRLFGTQAQSMRNTILQQRPLLLQAIMKATGMSAKQMDSNTELKLYLSTATDPTLDVAANRRALDKIEELYGSGKAPDQPAPASAPAQKFNMLPPAKDYAGKRMKADDGTIYRSNGTSWVKE